MEKINLIEILEVGNDNSPEWEARKIPENNQTQLSKMKMITSQYQNCHFQPLYKLDMCTIS